MNTLFAKLLKSYVVVLLTAILVIGGALSYFYTESLFDAREEELVENGRRLASAFEESLRQPQSIVLLRTRVEAIAGTLKANITLANREGLITLTTYDEAQAQNMIRLSPDDVRQVLNNGAVVTRRGYEETLNDQVVTAIVPVRDRGSVVGAVILHAPIRGMLDALRKGSRLLLLAGALAAAAGVLVSYVLSRRIVAPIRDMTAASEEMVRGRFERRVQVEGTGEIATLGSAFNRLASQLGETIDALTQETKKTESILTAMSEGVVAVDPAGKVMLTNPSFSRLLGSERSWHGVSMENDPQLSGLWPFFQKVLGGGVMEPTEIHHEHRTFSLHVSPLIDAEGRLSGAVGILHDISERFHLEKMRREFLANVSHELRTPLTSIRGFAQAILEGVVSAEDQVRRYLHVIMDESLRLTRLVNTLLDLSRLESNAAALHFEPVDVGELLVEVAEVLDPLMREREIRIESDVPPLPPVIADRDRLAQVWLNLLDNAVRHSPKGGTVRVRASAVVGSPDDQIVIDVENEGQGIPEEELPYIWERFYKVDKARRYERGVGTGLGLVIVKELVERHGGSVRAENLPSGTRFRVTLPIRRRATA